jgi:membrane protease YdiL (CAAX protease family)
VSDQVPGGRPDTDHGSSEPPGPPAPEAWPPPRPAYPDQSYPGPAYPGQPNPGPTYPGPAPQDQPGYPWVPPGQGQQGQWQGQGQPQWQGQPPQAYQGYPGYPAPPVQQWPSFPHAEPTPYHRMLRTWTYSWWRPVLGSFLVVIGMVLVMPLVFLPLLAAAVAISGGPFWETFEEALSLQTVEPAGLLYLNVVLGSTILVTWFVIRFVHRMRPRWLTSVVPKMRWRFLGICLGLSVVALVAQLVVSALLPGQTEADLGPVNEFTRTTAITALIVIITTPFQAAGEEYVFRGYLLMAVGSLFRWKWVAILVTALLFASAHGVQNFPLFFDRFMFGLIAGWLVIRTGGLEAAIALHILNNFLAYAIALSFGDLTETLTVSEVGWWNVPLTLTQSGVYAVLVVLVARRMDLQTRTAPPVGEPVRPPEVARV